MSQRNALQPGLIAKSVLTLFLLCFISVLHGQKTGVCGNHAADHSPYFQSWYLNAVRQIQTPGHAKRDILRSDTTYRITVVFHLIYPVNSIIDHSRLPARIAELNADFMRMNKDTVNLREIFRPRAGNPRIEFVLASTTPDGLPSRGYTLTQSHKVYRFGVEPGTPFSQYHDMKFADSGGANAWPTDRYLNIWVCNMSSPVSYKTYVAGFATPPSGAPHWSSQYFADSTTDGIVLSHETFQSPYRTATLTHEAGHYLGLRHVSGDPPYGIRTGNEPCRYDDFIDDTPMVGFQNFYCNKQLNTCVEDSADMPDMLENFMDYTAYCRNSFTRNQAALMRYCLRDLRPGLYSSDVQTWYSEDHPSVRVYPNPFQRTLQVDFTEAPAADGHFTLWDASGKQLLSLPLTLAHNALELPDLPSGYYLCRISSAEMLPVFQQLFAQP